MKSIVLFVLTSLAVNGYSQTLMRIDNEEVSLDEFQKIYQKNNPTTVSYSRKNLTDYLELFTLYKMKLKQARSIRLDTLPEIQDDYTKYTDQLAKKMMADKNYMENIMRSQYEHMKSDVKIAHIMVRCDRNASPNDSLLAYNKIKLLKEKANVANFGDIAKEHSEDKGSSVNNGLLGYISAFMTANDFEEQCYNTPVNTLSPIFRTQFGYHILKVLDRRPARGRIRVAHIYIANKNEEETKAKIAETAIQKAYKELQNKVSFEKAVAKYSLDKSSMDKNGELPEFGVSEMIQDFEDQAFALVKAGDYSKPFKTDYGWHIVRLIEKLPIKSYEESKNIIKQKLERDTRVVNMNEIMSERVSEKFNLKENPKALTELSKTIHDTFFSKKDWVLKPATILSNETLFIMDNKLFSIGQFATYVNTKFKSTVSPKSTDLLIAMYKEYKNRMIWDIAKSKLKLENEEYRSLDLEYLNGLMIFELMDQEIWKKAVKDSQGSKKIYEEMKNEFKYNTRIELVGVSTKSKDVNERLNLASYNYSSAKDLLASMKKTSDSNEVFLTEKIVEKGDDPKIDAKKWAIGIVFSNYDEAEKIYSVNYIQKILPPSIKPYNEIKGRVQNIYQTRLESQYNQSLRKKFKVNVLQDVLNKIIKE